MEDKKSIFAVIKTDAEKTEIIMGNILKMLGNRMYIDKTGEKKPLINPSKTQIQDRGDGIFTLKSNNGDEYAIKLIMYRISSTGKQSDISEFFKNYAQQKKIVVARGFNNKIADYMSKHRTQIFEEGTLLQDIISYCEQPQFELLSPAEMALVKTEYNATDYTIKKILRSDPIVKYYALRKGDIIRIVRASPTSGLAIDYRIVM